LERQFFDAVNTLENIAKKGSSINRIDTHAHGEAFSNFPNLKLTVVNGSCWLQH